jgi:predicted nucleic acid-binding protein
VSLPVHTSVRSPALRRNAPADVPEVRALRDALAGAEIAATTGVVRQELLKGVVPERARTQIVEMFAALEYHTPSREDHAAVAGVRNTLRAAGVQVGTIGALIAHLAIPGGHRLLTTDDDVRAPARHISL